MKNPAHMTRNKALFIDWSDLTSNYDTVPVLRALTQQQYTALIAICDYFGWRTRWENPPDAETLDLFAGETKAALMTDIAICAYVIACITDDDDVRAALNQWFIDQVNAQGDVYYALTQVYEQNVGGKPMPPAVREKNILPPIPDCDMDKLFGAIFYLIDTMNRNNINVFEAAELITNVLERASLLISAIPVFETLPIEEFIEYVETLWTDDVFEAYVANDTDAYTDQVKCDLRCIAEANGCVLSIEDVFNYFCDRIAFDPQQDFPQLVAFMVTGTWIGTQINDIFFALQLAALYYGNQFFDFIGLKSYATMLAIGAKTPNDTWMLICDACPTELPWEIVVIPGFNTGELTYDDVTGEYTLTAQANTDSVYRAVAKGVITGDWIVTSAAIPVVDYPAYYPADSESAVAGVIVSGQHYNGISYASLTPFSIVFTLTDT